MNLFSKKYIKNFAPVFLLVYFSFLFFPGFTNAANLSIQATVLGDGEEAGGGGGGYLNVPSSVSFSGIAYPYSPVYILKNGQDFISTSALDSGLFSVSINNLSSGSYTFSVVTEDTSNRRSTLFTFPLAIVQNVATNISGIFLSPTIYVNGEILTKDTPLVVSGQSAPNASITIEVGSILNEFFSVVSDSQGFYSKTLDTKSWSYGSYQIKSKASLFDGNDESPFSSLISFSLSTDESNLDTGGECLLGDVNCDLRVNIVDFSILAFWYRKDNPPEKIDINKDGRIDIKDFSILAYAWTG